MFKKTILTLISIMSLTLNSQTMVNNSIHQFKVADIYGDIFDFSKLKGKKVMIVNTASKCGLTFQYEALQKLYSQYKDLNFIVIGFPSNGLNTTGEEKIAFSARSSSNNLGLSPFSTSCHL